MLLHLSLLIYVCTGNRIHCTMQTVPNINWPLLADHMQTKTTPWHTVQGLASQTHMSTAVSLSWLCWSTCSAQASSGPPTRWLRASADSRRGIKGWRENEMERCMIMWLSCDWSCIQWCLIMWLSCDYALSGACSCDCHVISSTVEFSQASLPGSHLGGWGRRTGPLSDKTYCTHTVPPSE